MVKEFLNNVTTIEHHVCDRTKPTADRDRHRKNHTSDVSVYDQQDIS
jgi:hypothetical protein